MGNIGFLGSEVDKPSKILIKMSNAREYIESTIQNTEELRKDDLIIYYVCEDILTRIS